ncbi:hypothetical protein OROGR_019572 [Orobanche gracilis]
MENRGGGFTVLGSGLSTIATVDRTAHRCDGQHSAKAGGGRDTGKCTKSVYYLAGSFRRSFNVASH